jgi:hypothetical protein
MCPVNVSRRIQAALCVAAIGTTLVATAGSAFAAPGVTPASVTLNLPPGGSTTVAKTVSTPAIPPNPDIVFLVDTTTSMGPVITNVQSNGPTILGDVASAQPTAQFAVAMYKDTADAGAGIPPFSLLQNLTANQGAANTGLANLTPLSGGGSDAPEDGLNGLFQVATGAVAFRPGSARVVVWIGDASSHDPSAGHSLGATNAALNAAGIRVIALDVGPTPGEISDGLDNAGQATSVTNATGGQLFTGVQPAQVTSTILAGLHNLPVTVTHQLSGCDPALSVSLSPASRTVTSGNDAGFTENITVSPTAVPGTTITCSVEFLLNGTLSPGFTETITEHVPKASPAISTTPSGSVPAGGNISDSATLSGGFSPTGTVTFQLFGPGDTTCATPIATRTGTVAGGSAVSGNVAAGGVGTYRWVATYSGDSHNNAATSPCGSEQVVVVKATPAITTTPSGTVPAGGNVSDSASVSGGFGPTGSVTFQLFAPGDTTCSTPIATRTGALSGGTAGSGNVAAGGVGTYNWVATYTGDANNNAVVSPCGSEQVVVIKATPTIATTPSGTVPAGGNVSDTATISGGYLPTGTVTFQLFAPGDTTCSLPIATRTGTLAGGTATSGTVQAGAAGTYNWVATYSGDANNNSVVSPCGDEPVVVTPQVLTGRAYGLAAQASLLGAVLVNVAPTPDTGHITTTSSSTTSVPCVATVGGLVSAHVLCAEVATTAFPGRSAASASVNDTTVGILGIPTVSLAAVQSTSTTTCAGSAGTTTIAFLKVGNTVVISQPTNIAPNTTINLGVVKLVLNEQIPFSTPDAGLTVNAVHLTVNALGLAQTNVVVASSESDIGNCP